MTDSPTRPLWDAFAAVIDAGTSPPLRLGMEPILDRRDDSSGRPWPRVYRFRVEPNDAGEMPPPGYFLLGMGIETEAGCYNQEAGQDGLWRIHCWAETPDAAEQLYQWLKTLLHEVPLTVAGYRTVTGLLSKSGPIEGPGGTAYQVQASYETEALEAAA